jgi:hypothetical protein
LSMLPQPGISIASVARRTKKIPRFIFGGRMHRRHFGPGVHRFQIA